MAWEEWKVRLTQDGLVGGSFPSLCIDRRTERLVNCWGDFFLEVLLVFDGGFLQEFWVMFMQLPTYDVFKVGLICEKC